MAGGNAIAGAPAMAALPAPEMAALPAPALAALTALTAAAAPAVAVEGAAVGDGLVIAAAAPVPVGSLAAAPAAKRPSRVR